MGSRQSSENDASSSSTRRDLLKYINKAKRFTRDSEKTSLLALEFLEIDHEQEEAINRNKQEEATNRNKRENENKMAYFRHCMASLTQR